MSEPLTIQLPSRQRRLLWVAWGLVALLTLTVFVAAIPARFAQLLGDPYGFGNAYRLLGITVPVFAAYFTGIEILFALVFAAVAVVLFWKGSADWMAVLISVQFLAMGVSTPLSVALVTVNPLWHWPVLFLLFVAMNLALLMFLLFPDGRFIPRWSRWLSLGLALYTTLWFFIPELIPPIAILVEAVTFQDASTYLPLALMTIIGVVAQIYRYRAVANTLQRQQTKWVVFGFTAFLAGIVLVLLPFFLSSGFRQQGTAAALRFTILFGPVLLLAVALIPLSIALAILKYRLWDISFVVRRTLVYGLLSVILALIYFGSVIVLQRLFSAVSRQQSPIIIVVSTLIIAGLFSPLRGKIQDLIDRRFYRQKYDAALALDRFAKTARDEVDLNRLSAELVNVVQEAIQPEHASLWLADMNMHHHSKRRRSEPIDQ